MNLAEQPNSSMKKKLVLGILLLVLASIVTLSTAYTSKIEVSNKEELRSLSCGWPMQFITTNQSWRDPPYPWKVHCTGSQWGDPVEFSWLKFIGDAIFFYAIICIIALGLCRLFASCHHR